MVIARRRLKRLRLPGSAISLQRHQVGQRHQRAAGRTHLDRLQVGRCRRGLRGRPAASRRTPRRSRTKVVTRRQPIIVSSARPMSVTDTPRSAARWRSICDAHLRPRFLVVGVRPRTGPGWPPCAPACCRATARARRTPARPARSAAAGRGCGPGRRPPAAARARRSAAPARRAARRRPRRCCCSRSSQSLQEHDDVAGVHLLAGAEAAGHARVGALDRLALAAAGREDLLDLLHLLDGVVEAGAFRAR